MKAQIKMGETMAILVIFFFLVAFGFSFYVRMSKTTVPRDTKEKMELKAIQLFQKVSYMPELECSRKNDQVDNCFDTVKLSILRKFFLDPALKDKFLTQYYDTLGYSKISVDSIYPQITGGAFPLVLYNNALDSKKNVTYIMSAKVPVSLYDPLTDRYHFGVMTINVTG